MIKSIITTMSAVVVILSGVGYTATHANAAPVSDIQIADMSIRLQLVGIAPRPGLDITAGAVCQDLVDYPGIDGKKAVFDTARAAGYDRPGEAGYVARTMVDVVCPELVPVLIAPASTTQYAQK